jgi:hypothetical protein
MTLATHPSVRSTAMQRAGSRRKLSMRRYRSGAKRCRAGLLRSTLIGIGIALLGLTIWAVALGTRAPVPGAAPHPASMPVSPDPATALMLGIAAP